MTVQNIFDFLNEKFPTETACDFDNVGLLVGDPNSEVKKAVVALDCTPSAVNTAIKNGCQLIITHHPVIFDPLKRVLAGSAVYEVIKSGISVISMHTNLDVGIGGVNDCLSFALSLENVKKVAVADGYLLNVGELSSPLCPDSLAEYLKEKLGGGVKYFGADKKIERVLLCSGSGGSYLTEVKKHNCDALITADVKHNQFLDAERIGVSLFDAGHFETEDIVTEPLKRLLEQHFADITFISDRDSKIKHI
ncbi:MAG: Nif3-like dinuclear metal center hexameric protein [Acutalibacteraceae bacterium]